MSIYPDDADALYKDIYIHAYIYALVYTLHAGATEPSVKNMYIYMFKVRPSIC